jgi:hypothetical protein
MLCSEQASLVCSGSARFGATRRPHAGARGLRLFYMIQLSARPAVRYSHEDPKSWEAHVCCGRQYALDGADRTVGGSFVWLWIATIKDGRSNERLPFHPCLYAMVAVAAVRKMSKYDAVTPNRAR